MFENEKDETASTSTDNQNESTQQDEFASRSPSELKQRSPLQFASSQSSAQGEKSTSQAQLNSSIFRF